MVRQAELHNYIYYKASVFSRYNARSDWLSAAERQGRLRIMQIRKEKDTKGYPKLDHICFVSIENRCNTRR